MIAAIVAFDFDGCIGGNKDGQGVLPWPKLPADMREFVRLTKIYKNLVVGRKTWETLPELADRFVHVLSRKFPPIEKDLDSFIVIGGKEIYELYAPVVDVWYVTKVHGNFSQAVEDPVFLEFDKLGFLDTTKFYQKVVSSSSKEGCTFVNYIRK